ncbi:hypothetical protein MNBD_NITROSPINAE04-2241 [hydrothermal vent metagenome]|uniref:DinB family protein n=1 Tax=hydrothermal vent metagenome TaxID=652676 RepID=A0A3B1CAS4_9ZZZZ
MEKFPGYKRLFRFDADCKLKTLEFMRSSPSLDGAAINIFAHILSAENMWLSRLELGVKAPPPKLWREGRTLDQCADETESVIGHWTRFLGGLSEEDYSKQVSFINLKGIQVDRPVYDLLTQVLNHSTYHRGQIATLTGKREVEAPPTDYIFFPPD